MIMQSLVSLKNDFLKDFSEYLLKKIEIVSSNKQLQEWAKYSLLTPCKRLRPLMVFFASNCDKKSFDIALAIELIHTYSLIHDDLPAMDDDPIRRGVASLHKHTSEAAAILTGDMLLTFAFEIISTSDVLNDKEKTNCITILTKASGGSGLIEGQALDLFHRQTTQKHLGALYQKKTSALFIAALETGFLVCNQNNEKRELLKKLGLHFGIAFQLLDDLQDRSRLLKSFNKIEINNLYLKHKNLVFQTLTYICNQNLFNLCQQVLKP